MAEAMLDACPARAGDGVAEDPGKAAAAARALHACLSADVWPPLSRDASPSLAAVQNAVERAPRFLNLLADIYGVERWDAAAYRRCFVGGALASWRPGTRATEDAGGRELRIEMPGCPLRAACAQDPRVCAMCEVFQEAVARLTMPGEVERVVFEELASRGGERCVMRVERRAPRS